MARSSNASVASSSVHALEPRRLFAASAVLNGGVVAITGTADAETVVVTQNTEGVIRVLINGVQKLAVPQAQVEKITASLLEGNDTFRTEGPLVKRIELSGGLGDDNLRTAGGNDVIEGGGGNDSIFGAAGVDKYIGGDGNDLLIDSDGADDFSGGGGLDTVTYAERTYNLKIRLDDVANDGKFVEGVSEGDNVRRNNERVVGGTGNDSIFVIPPAPTDAVPAPQTGPYTIEGNKGNDAIGFDGPGMNFPGTAVEPRNVLLGQDGNDSLYGSNRSDSMNGGGGNDSLFASEGSDDMAGGPGIDTVSYASRTAALKITLDNVNNDGAAPTDANPNGERDNVRNDNERVLGGGGNDEIRANPRVSTVNAELVQIVLVGNGGADKLGPLEAQNSPAADGTFSAGLNLIGEGGNDTLGGSRYGDSLSGGEGNDNLAGGYGSDTLTGGAGNDLMEGGQGNDRFFAKDGAKDSIFGGDGTDTATVDEIDALTSIESIVP